MVLIVGGIANIWESSKNWIKNLKKKICFGNQEINIKTEQNFYEVVVNNIIQIKQKHQQKPS